MKLHVQVVIAKLFIICLIPGSVSRVIHIMFAHVVLENDDEYVYVASFWLVNNMDICKLSKLGYVIGFHYYFWI